MDSRQRVMTAISHREPDRVPVDFWATDEVYDALLARTALSDRETLLRRFGVDFRYVYGPSELGQEAKTHPDGSVEDLWGVRRKLVVVSHPGYTARYWEVADSPLAEARTVADVEGYSGWPDPTAWDFSRVARALGSHRGYAVVNAGNRLDRTAQLKPAMYLRGVEQILVDLHLAPAVAEAIFAHIRDYFLEYNRRLFQAAGGGIDIFMMGDDFGTQHGPMMDTAMWRRFFRDGFRRYIDLAHSFGIRVMHHTCGAVRSLIPDFIECGLDILQSLQPQATGMDLGGLKRDFGRDLVLAGSIDLQGALVHGTPAQVRDEVRRKMTLGKSGGGFVISTAHNIQPDAPVENVLALVNAYEEFRDY